MSEPFRIQRLQKQPYIDGFPQGYVTTASFPDWTARERIAVECFKAMLTGVDVSGHCEIALRDRAVLAFKAADALLAAGGEEPR